MTTYVPKSLKMEFLLSIALVEAQNLLKAATDSEDSYDESYIDALSKWIDHTIAVLLE